MPQAHTKTLQHSAGRHVMPLLPVSKTSTLTQKIDTRKLIVAKLCKVLALFLKQVCFKWICTKQLGHQICCHHDRVKMFRSCLDKLLLEIWRKKVIIPSVPKNFHGAGKTVSENHYICLTQNHKTMFVTICYLEEVCLEILWSNVLQMV